MKVEVIVTNTDKPDEHTTKVNIFLERNIEVIELDNKVTHGYLLQDRRNTAKCAQIITIITYIYILSSNIVFLKAV